MKSEAEIRRHRDDLIIMIERPCECDTQEARDRCAISRKSTLSAVQALSWALGELPQIQESIDKIRQTVESATVDPSRN